jgi:hypothetical protein
VCPRSFQQRVDAARGKGDVRIGDEQPLVPWSEFTGNGIDRPAIAAVRRKLDEMNVSVSSGDIPDPWIASLAIVGDLDKWSTGCRLVDRAKERRNEF